MSYRQIFYHIVFGTKHREATLTESCHEDLYKYIWGIIKNKKCRPYRINGTEDHVHIFSDLHPSVSLADYIKDIKVASSLRMKESGGFPALPAGRMNMVLYLFNKRKDVIIRYIKNQKEHHKKESFFDEYKRLLTENDILFEEKYLL